MRNAWLRVELLKGCKKGAADAQTKRDDGDNAWLASSFHLMIHVHDLHASISLRIAFYLLYGIMRLQAQSLAPTGEHYEHSRGYSTSKIGTSINTSGPFTCAAFLPCDLVSTVPLAARIARQPEPMVIP